MTTRHSESWFIFVLRFQPATRIGYDDVDGLISYPDAIRELSAQAGRNDAADNGTESCDFSGARLRDATAEVGNVVERLGLRRGAWAVQLDTYWSGVGAADRS